jgi:Spy/CpxP family protein refolding chaperone
MSMCPMHAEHMKISTLSETQVSDYLAGAGMGLGRTGELNGYPGPKHVLEQASQLGITPEQKSRLEASMKTMHEAASRLGEQIIAKERQLDHLFASGDVDQRSMALLTAEIGELQGRLRAAHLAAHLDAKKILSESQVKQYMEKRGHAGHQ